MGDSEDHTEQIIEFEKRSRQLVASRMIDRRRRKWTHISKKWHHISVITRLDSSNFVLIALCLLFLITIVPFFYQDRQYNYMILMAVILTTTIFLAIWFPLHETSSLDGFIRRFDNDIPTIRSQIDRHLSARDLTYQTIDDIEWGGDKKNLLFIIRSQDEIRISLWEYEEGTLVHIGPVRGTTLKTIHGIKRAIDKGK